MSPTWYTWIEQGRDISVSAAALARLATALRLTVAERAYLFELARQRDPSDTVSPTLADDDDHPITLQAALDAMVSPAYLLDPRWCAIRWNLAAAALFADWFGTGERCLIEYMFLDVRSRRLVPDWDERARRLVAEFRADTGRRPNDSVLQTLIARLRQSSPAFAALWIDHSVLAREGGLRRFEHPTLGPLLYRQITLHPATAPDHKLVMLVETEIEGKA